MSARQAFISDILFENKLLRDQVAAFENGEKYRRMRESFRTQLADRDRTIKKLRKDLADARAQVIKVRDYWMRANEDILNEKKKTEKKAGAAVRVAERKAAVAARNEEEARIRLSEKTRELYETRVKLMEAEDKIKEQDIIIHKDYTNSSKPSSQSPNHKKIPNSREKSGRPRGGQKGHAHHGRKALEPDEVITVPAPAEYLDIFKYKPTGKTIRKQVIGISVSARVKEYRTPEFRNVRTGQRVHAVFPNGLKDEVTYDGSVKAMAYLLNNELYVSIGKTRAFIREISDGKVCLSDGMVCGLSREFSLKTKEERDRIFRELLNAPYMNADFTFGRKDGKTATALICTSGDAVLYQAKEKKGYEGVKDSPLTAYCGTVVSDHEAALTAQGGRHQECLSHVKRYAIAAEQSEPDKTWPSKLKAWIGESIRYWNRINNGEESDPAYVAKQKDGLLGILSLAGEEYEYVPAPVYFNDGYNLCKRMAEKPGDYTLFLDDPSVPPTNNAAERAARKFKRKAHQVMTFRSDKGMEYFCDGLSVTQTMKARGENLYLAVRQSFDQ